MSRDVLVEEVFTGRVKESVYKSRIQKSWFRGQKSVACTELIRESVEPSRRLDSLETT